MRSLIKRPPSSAAEHFGCYRACTRFISGLWEHTGTVRAYAENIFLRHHSNLMRKVLALSVAFILTVLFQKKSEAFQGYNTIITTSSVVETTLLAQTSSQFLGTIVPNPFSAGTYTMNLTGLNPNYVPTGSVVQPPPPLPCQLDQDVKDLEALLPTIASDSYTNGWINGWTTEIYRDTAVDNHYLLSCSSTNTFHVLGSTSTFDTKISSTTCLEVLREAQNATYQLLYSTPLVTPGGF